MYYTISHLQCLSFRSSGYTGLASATLTADNLECDSCKTENCESIEILLCVAHTQMHAQEYAGQNGSAQREIFLEGIRKDLREASTALPPGDGLASSNFQIQSVSRGSAPRTTIVDLFLHSDPPGKFWIEPLKLRTSVFVMSRIVMRCTRICEHVDRCKGPYSLNSETPTPNPNPKAQTTSRG